MKAKAEIGALPNIFGAAAVDDEVLLPVDSLADELATLTDRLLAAAKADSAAFTAIPGWPSYVVPLSLRLLAEGAVRPFDVAGLVGALDAYPSMTVIAPPGTGKTITLLQMVEAVHAQRGEPAVFLPLSEWSSQSRSLLASIIERRAFRGVSEEDLRILAAAGRLTLFLDGWNELDTASRLRAERELKALRRDYPHLGLVVSTRARDMGAQLNGPVVEIDTLDFKRQQELARALKGASGEATLDHAWRTPGVRDLVGTPLYLRALLDISADGSFPSTKEAVLRKFVERHDQDTERYEALKASTFGFQSEYLQGLAGSATRAGNTTITDFAARAEIKRVGDRLVAQGQLAATPQPGDVLTGLIAHHSLVRAGERNDGVTFQHQQFQEWHASAEVERLMRAATSGDAAAREALRFDVLDMPAWEEAILFACERVARADEHGLEAVAASVFDALEIDPLLAAEMIFRAGNLVWGKIGERVESYAKAWHQPGKIDRAFAFMMTTGREDFFPLVWPLITASDSQVHLPALRAAPHFRPSVLGNDVGSHFSKVETATRANILSEIASHSGIDGIELATALAKADESGEVKAATIQSLLFRGAQRFALDILAGAPDDTWERVSRQYYEGEIEDDRVVERLLELRRQSIARDQTPLARLQAWQDGNSPPAGEITDLIAASDFAWKDDRASQVLTNLHQQHPHEVGRGLMLRLERGQRIPFRTSELIAASQIIVDEGVLVERVLDASTPDEIAMSAARVIGADSIAKLLDAYLDAQAQVLQPGRINEEDRKRYFSLRDRLSVTPQALFLAHIASFANASDPGLINTLADLISVHGEGRDRKPLELTEGEADTLATVLESWAEALPKHPQATRSHMGHLAQSIARVPIPRLAASLDRLLQQDLTRWRDARAAFKLNPHRGSIPPDVSTSYVMQYRFAFEGIGGDDVAQRMIGFLADRDFCIEAAWVLKHIWEQQEGVVSTKRLASWNDFSQVRRLRAQSSRESISHPFADQLFAAAASYLAIDDDVARDRALALATAAFSLPHGDRAAMLDQLITLAGHRERKLNLLTMLVMRGKIVPAEWVMQGLHQLYEDAKTKTWLLTENRGEVEGWLDLMPFTNRPAITLEGLAFSGKTGEPSWRLRRLFSALGNAPDEEAEWVLIQLAKANPSHLGEHEWVAALASRQTKSAVLALLELLISGAFRGARQDSWYLAQTLARMAAPWPDLLNEIHAAYLSAPAHAQGVLAHAIADLANEDSILTLVRGHALHQHQELGVIREAVDRVALGRQPVEGWKGAYEIFPVAVPNLRRELLALTASNGPEAPIAVACLSMIDHLRDEYGRIDSEPRHPDIRSGVPWPQFPLLGAGG